eukprot:CAMPEP_0171085842 /NCGR_PEP_ID=MMETSP0766_2-20121228/19175_1 /TAXON_ID=439317 /ORGANISM="Gambierdiscus australes, Strain CAWD 149" /LENGTH=118 /DNA_ID=CAMNT_0011543435 /DNA_START=84 /DNA_END=436 /DNA_ORIENTATION=+
MCQAPLANRIYIAGLNGSVNEDDLRQYFGKFGPTVDVYIPFNVSSGQKKNFAFVTFATELAAKEAIASSPHQLKGISLDVRVCKPKPGDSGAGVGKVGANDAGPGGPGWGGFPMQPSG